MAYAIIQTGGKQYKVSPGEIIDVELLDVEPGASAVFSDVLLHADGASINYGTPIVQGATVTGKVMEHRRARKVTAYKPRPRKGYQRTIGHRQGLTRVKIESIAT